jgi:hypothetical protein
MGSGQIERLSQTKGNPQQIGKSTSYGLTKAEGAKGAPPTPQDERSKTGLTEELMIREKNKATKYLSDGPNIQGISKIIGLK